MALAAASFPPLSLDFEEVLSLWEDAGSGSIYSSDAGFDVVDVQLDFTSFEHALQNIKVETPEIDITPLMGSCPGPNDFQQMGAQLQPAGYAMPIMLQQQSMQTSGSLQQPSNSWSSHRGHLVPDMPASLFQLEMTDAATSGFSMGEFAMIKTHRDQGCSATHRPEDELCYQMQPMKRARTQPSFHDAGVVPEAFERAGTPSGAMFSSAPAPAAAQCVAAQRPSSPSISAGSGSAQGVVPQAAPPVPRAMQAGRSRHAPAAAAPEQGGSASSDEPVRTRQEALERYRQKKASRMYTKKIRYQLRKINADKRPRIKGRFVKKSELAQYYASMGIPNPALAGQEGGDGCCGEEGDMDEGECGQLEGLDMPHPPADLDLDMDSFDLDL
mmetsp:Transcript_34779/g.88087  ORF Transcript_34779/g.88087 Transcript_34779/m.88087 type:complete len:385 (-) Transcript_34779:2027-3181(-)